MSREYLFVIQGNKFRFDPHGVDVEVIDGDHRIHLTPTERNILTYHLERSGNFVPDEELLKAIWQGKDVYPSLPGKHTRSLRKKIADAIGLNESDREQLFERSGKLGYRFQPDRLEVSNPVEDEVPGSTEMLARTEIALLELISNLSSTRDEQSGLDTHRAELLIFTPHINDFLSVLGELRDIAEILTRDPSSTFAAAMLQDRIEDFKGLRVDSNIDLFIEMQKYLGYYMNVVSLLFDGLHMLANERVYGFNDEKGGRSFSGHRIFRNDMEFQDYLQTEVHIGVSFLNSAIAFVKQTFLERPDIAISKPSNKDCLKDMIQWSRKIAQESRGDEMLFERT